MRNGYIVIDLACEKWNGKVIVIMILFELGTE